MMFPQSLMMAFPPSAPLLFRLHLTKNTQTNHSRCLFGLIGILWTKQIERIWFGNEFRSPRAVSEDQFSMTENDAGIEACQFWLVVTALTKLANSGHDLTRICVWLRPLYIRKVGEAHFPPLTSSGRSFP